MGPGFWGRGAAAACIVLGSLIVGVVPAWGGAFPSATNGRIVYTDGDQIMTANPDGTDPVQLTNYDQNTSTVAAARVPRWSPDGKQIVYQAVSGTTVSIDVMNADGSDQHAVFSGSDATPGSSVFPDDPSFSPDGTKIVFDKEKAISPAGYFNGGIAEGLYTMGADGSNPTALNVTGLENNEAAEPQYSPDGSKIVFDGVPAPFPVGCRQVAVVPAGGGAATFLTSDPVYNDSWPEFSPGGTKIVWQSEANCGGNGQSSADIMNSNGTGQTTLAAGESFAPTFSPDGSTVMLSSSTHGGTTSVGNNFLYTLPAAGGGLTDTGLVADIGPADWGPAPIQPSAILASKSVSIGKGKVAVHCNHDGQCHILGTLTTVEHKAGATVVSVSKTGRLTMAKRERKVTVTIARATLSISAGGKGTLHFKLTATGKKLVKRFGKLPVELTVTVTNASPAQVIFQKSGKFK